MDRARLTVETEAAPTAIGPYGQAVRRGDTLDCSGVTPLAETNEASAAFFPDSPPARVTVGVEALPRAVRVEIDAVVAISD